MTVFPSELTSRQQWLLWRFEQQEGDKKPRKVPYYAKGSRRTGEQGSPQDRAKLVDYDTAMALVAGYDGVGFAFLPDDGLIGVDLDACINTDDEYRKRLAASVIKKCASFTEFSPSGNGVHIILSGTCRTFKSNDIGVEVFCGRQFFTMTGNVHPESAATIGPMTDELLQRFRRVVDEAKEARKGKQAAVTTQTSQSSVIPQSATAKVESALAYISPDCGYDDWIKIGMAIHAELGAGAQGVWDYWSRKGSKYCGEAAIASHWRSFDGGGVTGGTLFKLAMDAGWRPPLPRAVVQPAADSPAVSPSAPAAVVVPQDVADLEQFFYGHFFVLGKCVEHRVWIRDERTGELRAFKEQELARKATLISLAPANVWADATDAYMKEQTRFSADIGMSIVMEIAKAKPRYARPVAKAEPSDAAQLTGKHGADSAIIAKLIRDMTLYDEYSCNWYSWDTIWRKNSEGNVERTIISVLDAAFSLEYDLGAFSGTFKLLKTRLGRSPQMTQDNSAAFDNWNRDRNLLPMRNGVLDLTTRQLIPHTPELMMSWMIPHDYSPTAKCPRIEQFLHTLSQGDEATETILLCYLAAILHGRADLQRYIEVVGMAGTGKSTFIHICEALVGSDNVMVTTMDQLHNNRFETASMFGKRLVIISDADKYGGSVEVFKAITGQDPIRYEEKNKQVGKPFIFSGMVVVAANQPLQFSDSSTAMVRRRIPVHIDKKLDKASIDPNLKDKLSEELPGLINLLLTINHDTVTSKLRDFEGARRAAEMRAMCETNTIAAWLDENCIAADVASRIGTIKNPADEFLYSNYALFCESTGRRGTLALQSFTRAVLDVLTYCGIKSDKKVTMHGKCITGLRLRTPVDSHVPSMLTGERATA